MRIRNYFFLALGIVAIGVSSFYYAKPPLPKAESVNVTVKPDLYQNEDSKVSAPVSGTTVLNSTSTVSVGTTVPAGAAASIPKKEKTIIPVFKLDVPYFHQQYANSCEAASLRMALAYYKIDIDDDMDIVQNFGYKPRDKNVELNEWDNPQEMFVGNIDIVGSTKGYGVYGKPVVKAAITYGRNAVYETNITAQFLSSELKAGHPVIIWGYSSITAPAYTWNLKDGGEVKAFKGEHARVVIGFEGDINNPTGFYVHDPFNGKKSEYWPVEKLIKHVNAVPGVTNQAVVVK